MEEIQALVGRDAADWLREEMDKSPTLLLPKALSDRGPDGRVPYRNYIEFELARTLLNNNDSLRTRMTLALSQILVVGQTRIASDFRAARSMQYVDVLHKNAFGNYRDLLEEVTLSPIMAEWLTYLNNNKGDAATGRQPDENFARELLQLFTIGLFELNADGTPRLNSSNDPVELYDNEDIVNLARVFTGYSYANNRFGRNSRAENDYLPLEIYSSNHSTLEKNFLNISIPPNTDGNTSLQMTLDGIFSNSNLAPFICRQLIQRFTASNPSPAYVRRVVDAFESGTFTSSNGSRFGIGERGDLEATIAAILLDDSLFIAPSSQPIAAGKINEPLLRFIRWAHAFEVDDLNQLETEVSILRMGSTEELGMAYFQAPSVFNFYRPGYVAPRTESGRLGLTAPELQSTDALSVFGYANFMIDFVFDRTNRRPCSNISVFSSPPPCVANSSSSSLTPNYSAEIAFANDAAALTDHLDLLLTGNRMLASTKSDIMDAINSIEIRTGTANEEADRLNRVHTAVYMAVLSPAFIVTN